MTLSATLATKHHYIGLQLATAWEDTRFLTVLRELAFDTRFCYDIRKFCELLKRLTALTHLSLVSSNESGDISDTAVASALASCKPLELVSLEGCTGCEVRFFMALGHLQHLTALSLSKFWVHRSAFVQCLTPLTQLVSLDLRGMHGWDVPALQPRKLNDTYYYHAVYPTIRHISRLQQFSAWVPCTEGLDVQHPSSTHMSALISTLPATVTALDLLGNSMCTRSAAHLVSLTNLQHLSLAGCTLPVTLSMGPCSGESTASKSPTPFAASGWKLHQVGSSIPQKHRIS